MKIFTLAFVLTLILSNQSDTQAADSTSQYCEVFIDKIVPVKEHKSFENITYSRLDFYIKVRKDLLSKIKSVNFYSNEQYFHYQGSVNRKWINTQLTRIAPDYFKITVMLDIHNHYIAKYSSTSIVKGNFNIKFKNGNTIWTHNQKQNISIQKSTLNLMPIPTKWVNDGGYNLAQIPSVGNFDEGIMSTFNLNKCL